MNENIVKIEAKGFQDLCNHIRDLEEKNKILEKENKQLKADNKILGDELTYFKEYSVDLEDKVNDLSSENTHFKAKNLALVKRCRELSKANSEMSLEIKDMKFTKRYLTSEEAGKAFARELLGKPMTPEDLAEERAITEGEALYERTWNVACGDDF